MQWISSGRIDGGSGYPLLDEAVVKLIRNRQFPPIPRELRKVTEAAETRLKLKFRLSR